MKFDEFFWIEGFVEQGGGVGTDGFSFKDGQYGEVIKMFDIIGIDVGGFVGVFVIRDSFNGVLEEGYELAELVVLEFLGGPLVSLLDFGGDLSVFGAKAGTVELCGIGGGELFFEEVGRFEVDFFDQGGHRN